MTGSGIMGQCYSDHEWLPVDKQCTTGVMENNIHPCKTACCAAYQTKSRFTNMSERPTDGVLIFICKTLYMQSILINN